MIWGLMIGENTNCAPAWMAATAVGASRTVPTPTCPCPASAWSGHRNLPGNNSAVRERSANIESLQGVVGADHSDDAALEHLAHRFMAVDLHRSTRGYWPLSL